ncbi:MAG: hypothetical protein OQL19_10485 [Gammaproteobacteria bacterium]|nr:hypothetical protein [Gammaproteobacteria bacterium]
MSINFKSVEPLSGKFENLSSQDFTEVFMDCYTPISQSQFTLLAANDCEFFKDSRTDTIFTYGTQDASFILMPLEDKYAREILKQQR